MLLRLVMVSGCMDGVVAWINVPMMLKVIAAASAPLLINVGSGRVRRGGSSSPTGTPVRVGGGSDDGEIELEMGCVGRAILLEKIREIVDVGDTGDVGDAVEDVCVVLVCVILVCVVLVCVELVVVVTVVTVVAEGSVA